MGGVFSIVLLILNHLYASLLIIAACCVPVWISLKPAYEQLEAYCVSAVMLLGTRPASLTH